MQIYATDLQGTKVHARQACRKQNYFCPECKTPVRLRGGRLRQLHYYHLESACCRLHGKSLTHLQIQYALQKILTPETVLLEHYFPQIARRADAVWPAKNLIFEIQVSPISAAEVKARNRDYQRIGYTVVWILHDRQFNRFYISAAEAALRFSTHYFTNINALGKGFFYDQYAPIRFKKRISRTNRLPIDLKQVISVNPKQLPRQFPLERTRWNVCFAGDLFHGGFNWQELRIHKPSFSNKWFLRPYRILLQLLLEKTTF